jgi:carbamoyl-phosphate synthase large subunit
LGLNVVGLMNILFAIKGDDIYVLEVNPRASRTVPFVAKATGLAIAKIAARVMAGEALRDFQLDATKRHHFAVKEAVFPFARFPGVDIILGPEMKSTGEVMGLDSSFARAFLKAQLGAGQRLPRTGTVFISLKDKDKPGMVPAARKLLELGLDIVATPGTASYLRNQGLDVRAINARRDQAHVQHGRRPEGDRRQLRPASGGIDGTDPVLHHHGRCLGGGRSGGGARQRRSRCGAAAILLQRRGADSPHRVTEGKIPFSSVT